MRFGFILLMLAALAFAPLCLWAGAPQTDNGSRVWATVRPNLPDLNRDEADDDSVYYSYGFEDGWSGWSTDDLTDTGTKWHLSESHAFEGNSWWCGDENLGGYNDHWLQLMMTPELDLSRYQGQAVSLTFKLYYASEEPAGATAPYNAWDGSNMWISINGGETWSILTPATPRYTNTSLFSFGDIWGMGANIPGWCGRSNGWVDGRVDLSAYAGRQNIVIRWAFCSDDGWCTADDANYIGLLLDNISITANENVIFTNNGDEQGDEDEMSFEVGDTAGDFWEISEAEHHSGRFSAHCPIQRNIRDALVSPELEILGDPWYTYFDFWVHADTRNCNPNGDRSLDDYYVVEYTTDGVLWDKVFHDYGRNADWLNGWHYFGPDTSYPEGHDEEWKGKLNLTQFGGQTVQLRWVLKTDSIMSQNEGSGLWIDDFRLMITARPERDVSVDWISIPHPVALNFQTRCSIQITNNGMLDMDNVQHFYRINDFDDIPIVPWEGIDSDSSEIYFFTFNAEAETRLPYADVVSITGTALGVLDRIPENDEITVENVAIYPENVWVMGYDYRNNPIYHPFGQGHGPAVYFTPANDGIPGNFDIKAVRVLWNGLQVQQTSVNLHVYADNNRRPGQQLYNTTVTVLAGESNPHTNVIDLTDVGALQGLRQNFWIWFEITNADNIPAPTGDRAHPGSEGHYFEYDGNTLTELDYEFFINPVLMPAGAHDNRLVAGRDTIDFGPVPTDAELEIPFKIFNGGIEIIQLQSVSCTGASFTAACDSAMPYYLQIGDYVGCKATFSPSAERRYTGAVTIRSNAPELVVPLIGTGDNGIYVPGEPVRQPAEFALGEAYPNPFNLEAVIPFSLPNNGFATLTIYDLNGRTAAVPLAKELPAGSHTVVFDGKDLAAGVYICQLDFEGRVAFTKLALVK